MSKMSLAQKALSKTRLYLRKYSATALACGAAAGVIATAIMAVRATPKAIELIKADSREKYSGKEDSYTKLEAFKSSWKCYIPSAAIGLATISCILGANLLNKRQQAAVASTCALLSSAYKEYKDKVKRLYGEETHRNIINSIAVEKCKDVNITAGSIIISSSLNFKEDKEPEITRTFYDSFSQRYFESTISKVIEAEYHLNRNFMLAGSIALNEFYEFLGLEKTAEGNSLGWSAFSGDIYWIDFNHYKLTLEDGMEIFVIDMVFEPSIDYLLDG